MIVAVDIGGTKITVALFAEKDLTLVQYQRLMCAEHASIYEVLERFLTDNKLAHKDLRAIAIGIAGPIYGKTAKLTNLDWEISADKIAKEFSCPHVYLLNDLEAHGYSIARKKDGEGLFTIREGTPRTGNKSLIAAGTGLGECILVWDGKRWQPSPSEGGHSSFSPTDDQQVELLRYAWRKHEHVSQERLVSGTFGYELIFGYFRDVEGLSVSKEIAAQLNKPGAPYGAIVQKAAEAGDHLCTHVMEMFVKLYASEAANLALKSMSVAGVYLGGGIAIKLLEWYKRGQFDEHFNAKGRFRNTLSEIPLHVITDELNASRGAAIFAAEKLRVNSH
jgi:glucokinase